ncbi:hypothetical protein V6N13_078972 [Hibiscus sabdariffa]|uniref:Uncharacterized protein n=1 Tax=Hibiscus sabdariffa TaxID=183260 RepID=A0ABR2RQ12_9ROSI
MAKRAVLVGCNYPKTQFRLYGCINDVLEMQKLLLNRPEIVLFLFNENGSASDINAGNGEGSIFNLLFCSYSELEL